MQWYEMMHSSRELELRVQSYDAMKYAKRLGFGRKSQPKENSRSRSTRGWFSPLRFSLSPRFPVIFVQVWPAVSLHAWLRFARVAYQNVHLDEYIISSHCIIFIWAHLDARNVVGIGLYDEFVRSVSANGILSFLPWLMCACYDPELYMCFVICHAIFTGVYAMYFCDICGD